MELNLNTTDEECTLKKHFFNLKDDRNDGLLLQVHHSFSDIGGENKTFRFIYGSFNEPGSYLAVADHKGHVFIINLEMEKYWQLPNFGLPTLLSFPTAKKQELLIGLDSTSILLVNIETGNVIVVLNGHSAPVTEVSYSDNGYYYLTSNMTEAIIWNSTTLTQVHRLSLKSDVALKRVLFMPVSNQILACFQDNTMNIWKFGTFECIKQIIPEAWKTHQVKTVALTKNGRALIIAGRSPTLVVFCLDTWHIMKVVEFPEFVSGIKQMEFVPQVFDGGANKIIALLTTSLELYFFNIETSTFLIGLHQIFGMTVKFTLNSNGKYIACFLSSGEVNIYLIEKILSNKKQVFEENLVTVGKISNGVNSRNYSNNSKKTQKSIESLSSVKKELNEVLDRKKILPILKQFGEYPESYRILIWKTILQLPNNQESFVSLSLQKCHSSYAKLESKYPLVNKSLCNSLKKLLSNLSHWCPLFGEVEFLPEFVFPFVKFFHSDPLVCFETVATIIVNWCQNWFEFYPFPPINMLSAMENILGYHDPDLLEFYLKNNITSSISVCPIFHTAFSEVLSKSEWLKLWDHILSNEPSFLFMAIIAYNVVCRNAIKGYTNIEELEKFFHKQKALDMKMLITKTYYFLKETPKDIHCRQFFAPFRPLDSGGVYTSFVAYPKLILDPSAEKLQVIRKEEDELLEEQLKALSIKKKLDKKLEKENSTEHQEKIYKEVDEKMRKLVEEEEDRVLFQRQKLQNLRHELRIRELEVLEDARNKALKERIKKKELEFCRLLKDVSKRKAREKLEVDIIEEEIRKYYSELLLRKYQLELELGIKEDDKEDLSGSLEMHRKKFQDDLFSLQNEWGTLHHSKRIELSNKMAAIKALIHDLETDVAKEMAEKDSEKHSQQSQIFVNQLKRKVRNLEEEVEKLLIENLNQLQQEQKNSKKAAFQLPTQHTFLSSRLKEKAGMIPERSTLIQDSAHAKNLAKHLSKSKPRKSRTFTQTISPGIRKTTTIRTRINKKKDFEQHAKPPYHPAQNANLKKPPINPKKSHLKSKFTCPNECEKLSSDSPTFYEENSNNFDNTSKVKQYWKDKRSHLQPRGDFASKEKLTDESKGAKGKRKEKFSKFTVLKDASSDDNESEEEIIKSAFKARKKLIEEAKIRQLVE